MKQSQLTTSRFRMAVAMICMTTSISVLLGYRYPFIPEHWMQSTQEMVTATAVCMFFIGLERLVVGSRMDVIACSGILSILINVILSEAIVGRGGNGIITERPSFLTNVGLLVFCAGNLLGFYGSKTKFVGAFLVLIGISALVSRGIDVPIMRGHVDGISVSMAIHTAVLFILVGLTQVTSSYLPEKRDGHGSEP